MPQLKFNKMISVTVKAKLLKVLAANFPDKTVKGNTNEDGSANSMVLVVPTLNHHQLNEISLISRVNAIQIDMKRSGTGISIKFS